MRSNATGIRIQAQTGVTTLHVKHSRAEARLLADTLFVLHEGTLAQRPLTDLEHAPASDEG